MNVSAMNLFILYSLLRFGKVLPFITPDAV